MSEAQSQILVNQIISYQQPLKEPNPAIGKVVEVYPTHIVLEHLNKAKNTIGSRNAYTIVDDKTPLTEVPIIKKITHNGTTFSVGNLVSYKIKGHPNVVIGRIKKITEEKDANKLSLIHKNKEVIIPITQSNLSLIEGNPDLTDYPVVQLTDVPFNVRDKVSYSLAGNTEIAIGEIIEIIIDRDGIKFKIMHTDGDKTITYKVRGIVVGNFKIVDQMSQPTAAPVKKMRIGEGDLSYFLQVGDMVTFIFKKVNVSGEVTDFNYKNTPPLIKVMLPHNIDVEIPQVQPGLTKVVAGRKKYTLEDENKYRLKYAKYKAKYLLLK